MTETPVAPSPEDRLAALGFPLPDAAAPLALYLPAVRAGDLVFTAGTIPIRGGELMATGHVGAEVDVEQAQACAMLAVANALTALRDAAGGLGNVRRIVKLNGFVASAPGFTRQPDVMNAASQLLIDVFGDAGRCARTAVGVAELPLGIPVEVDLVAQLNG